MRVQLISPLPDRGFAFNQGVYWPVGLLTIGSYLKRSSNDIQVEIIDHALGSEDGYQTDDRIGGDVVGIQASSCLTYSSNLEPWQRYYRQLSLRTNLFAVPPQPQTPAADVLLALSKYNSIIEELRQAAALPDSRFPLNYDSEEPAMILLPHLAPAKGCSLVLRMRALAQLEAGQSEAALADINLALRVTETIRSEPFLISQVVRIAMFQITVQALWEGLASHR